MGKIINGRFELTEHVAVLGHSECMDPEHLHRYVGGEMIPGCLNGPHCPECGKSCSHAGKHECEEGIER